MKKIAKLLFVFITVSISLLSCESYEDAPNKVPVLPAPEVTSVTESTARFTSIKSDYDLYISKNPDMSDGERYGYTSSVTGLSPNTTYYAQYVIVNQCRGKETVVRVVSPITEFKTNEYAPTPYTISMSSLPTEGYYGVFTTDGNGGSSYEKVEGGKTMKPSTKVADDSHVYVFAPYVSGVSSPTAVPVTGGEDFYYGSGTVNPVNPHVSISPKRFTAHVNVKITFKATKDEASSISLQKVAITNVSGNSPICLSGMMDITTGKFTPSQSGATQYINSSVSSIKNGASISRSFIGVIPVTFADNAVKVVVTMDGDIENKEVSLPLPAATWSEGSDVNINLNAEYTATGVELYIGYVEVIPWSEGSTGNIDITK